MRAMPMYDPRLVAPMREELTRVGFQELRTPEEVDAALRGQKGTALLLVNSVCGCSARNARPAAIAAVTGEARPEKLLTVFAGQDLEATQRAREFITGYPPSSPSMALFRDGKVVFMLERKDIEGRSPAEIATELEEAFEDFC